MASLMEWNSMYTKEVQGIALNTCPDLRKSAALLVAFNHEYTKTMYYMQDKYKSLEHAWQQINTKLNETVPQQIQQQIEKVAKPAPLRLKRDQKGQQLAPTKSTKSSNTQTNDRRSFNAQEPPQDSPDLFKDSPDVDLNPHNQVIMHDEDLDPVNDTITSPEKRSPVIKKKRFLRQMILNQQATTTPNTKQPSSNIIGDVIEGTPQNLTVNNSRKQLFMQTDPDVDVFKFTASQILEQRKALDNLTPTTPQTVPIKSGKANADKLRNSRSASGSTVKDAARASSTRIYKLNTSSAKKDDTIQGISGIFPSVKKSASKKKSLPKQKLKRINKTQTPNKAGDADESVNVDDVLEMVNDAAQNLKTDLNDETEKFSGHQKACERKKCRICNLHGSPCRKHRVQVCLNEPNRTYSGFWNMDFSVNSNKNRNQPIEKEGMGNETDVSINLLK